MSSNAQLRTLDDFPALTSIGVGYVLTTDNVSIVVENNPKLSDCSVLRKFLLGGDHAVSGKISIKNNAIDCNIQNDI